MNDNFSDMLHALSSALIDDFRGYLVDGICRLVVPDDMLHLQIAFSEMSKIPEWEYESGVNPMVEFMNYKRSIYITKIPMGNGFQRTVGFLTDVYNDEVLYKGQKMHQYEVLRKIALGMGYNVDEYSLIKNSDSNLRMPVSIVTYKCEFNISTGNRKTESNRHVTLGDKPVFEGDKLIGFISNGKFVNVSSYKRYADISKNHKKR